MSRHEIAWILVRSAGLLALIQALMVLPATLTALPVICQLIVSWDVFIDISLFDLLKCTEISHAVSVISQTVIYFVAASWMLVRGDCLIQLITEFLD